ncbi:MAG: hypothetical protein PHW77_05455 [Eubacteriales bacterium]|nr:hypothetical protein [Eubacteriales bacterium]
MAYPKYLLGAVLGMTPQMIAFTVIGTSITDIRSPAFIISVCAEALIVLCSAAAFALYKRKHKDNHSGR